MRVDIGMVDIEGAILHGDTNKSEADIIEMFVDC